MGILFKQECIPVGSVPPARLPYPVVSDWRGGLPNAPRCKPPSADTPWMQTSPGGRPPLEADPPVNRMTHLAPNFVCGR